MNHDVFYQAMLARDYRFDGKFFIGVKTTGIYCRPICPAKPKRENVEFFLSGPAAEKAAIYLWKHYAESLSNQKKGINT